MVIKMFFFWKVLDGIDSFEPGATMQDSPARPRARDNQTYKAERERERKSDRDRERERQGQREAREGA